MTLQEETARRDYILSLIALLKDALALVADHPATGLPAMLAKEIVRLSELTK